MIDILKYIPHGKEHPMTRRELKYRTGLPDRINRRLIEEAKKKHIIINLGHGYFQPILPDELPELKQYYIKEKSRRKSIGLGLKPIERVLKDVG